jgi:hypothetical protein
MNAVVTLYLSLVQLQVRFPLQSPPSGDKGGSNVPQPKPDPSGFPGQKAIETILNVISWLGIVGAVAAVIVGAGILAVGTGTSNSMYGSRGKAVILSGLAGGLIVAIAGRLVTWMVGLPG